MAHINYTRKPKFCKKSGTFFASYERLFSENYIFLLYFDILSHDFRMLIYDFSDYFYHILI